MLNLIDPNHDHKVSHIPNYKQWTTGITKDFRVFIQDDNFEYDARLYIDGDFLDTELKLRYADAIAEVLNRHTTSPEWKMLKSLKSYLTLKRTGYAFTDAVDGSPVYYYKDCYGDVWLKNSRWGTFKVKANRNDWT